MGDEIDPIGLNRGPYFYNNIAGLPQTNRVDSSGVVNSTVIPIVKHIKTVLKFIPKAGPAVGWDPVVVGHGLGVTYYTFIRWRYMNYQDGSYIPGNPTGTTGELNKWVMCSQPNVSSIDPVLNSIAMRFALIESTTSYLKFSYYNDVFILPMKETDIEVEIYFTNIPFPKWRT